MYNKFNIGVQNSEHTGHNT